MHLNIYDLSEFLWFMIVLWPLLLMTFQSPLLLNGNNVHVNPIKVKNFAYLFDCTTVSPGLRLNDGTSLRETSVVGD